MENQEINNLKSLESDEIINSISRQKEEKAHLQEQLNSLSLELAKLKGSQLEPSLDNNSSESPEHNI